MKLTVISLAYREEDGFDAGPLEEPKGPRGAGIPWRLG